MLPVIMLSACSTIKQWFPDKEKDYQFTTEIPELVLPPDLQNPQTPSLPMAAPAPIEPAQAIAPSGDEIETVVEPENPAPDINPAETTMITGAEQAAPDTAAPDDSVATASPEEAVKTSSGSASVSYQVDIISVDGQNGLRIHTSFANAWRAVDKALSRKAIEVNARDQDNKQFIVRYDPDEHDVQDSSFWDEVDFFFYGLKGKEKAYILKLTESGQWSDLLVFDEESQPASDVGAVKLIKLLEETIKSDFAR